MKDKFKRLGRNLWVLIKVSAIGLILIVVAFGVLIATNNVKAGWDEAVSIRMTEVNKLQSQLTQKRLELQVLRQDNTLTVRHVQDTKIALDDETAKPILERTFNWSSLEQRDDIRKWLQTDYSSTVSMEFLDANVPVADETVSDSASQKIVAIKSYVQDITADDAYTYATFVTVERTNGATAPVRTTYLVEYLVGTNNLIYSLAGTLLWVD